MNFVDSLRILALGLCATIVALALPFGSAQDGPSASAPVSSSTASPSSATPTPTWTTDGPPPAETDRDYDVAISELHPLTMHAYGSAVCPGPIFRWEQAPRVSIILQGEGPHLEWSGHVSRHVAIRHPSESYWYSVDAGPYVDIAYSLDECTEIFVGYAPILMPLPLILHGCHLGQPDFQFVEVLRGEEREDQPATSSPTPEPTWTTSTP